MSAAMTAESTFLYHLGCSTILSNSYTFMVAFIISLSHHVLYRVTERSGHNSICTSYMFSIIEGSFFISYAANSKIGFFVKYRSGIFVTLFQDLWCVRNIYCCFIVNITVLKNLKPIKISTISDYHTHFIPGMYKNTIYKQRLVVHKAIYPGYIRTKSCGHTNV